MRLAESLGGSSSEKLTRMLAGKLFHFSRAVTDPDELKALVGAFSAITDAERLQLQQRVADLKEGKLEIDRKRFQRDTCALFIKYVADQKAVEIAASPSIGNEAKIEMIGKHLFGEDW